MKSTFEIHKHDDNWALIIAAWNELLNRVEYKNLSLRYIRRIFENEHKCKGFNDKNQYSAWVTVKFNNKGAYVLFLMKYK